MMRVHWCVPAGLGVAVGFFCVFAACGSNAVGVQTCQTIESARCSRAPGCNISLTTPVHRDTPADDISACQRYYDVACLHGLRTTVNPSPTDVNACLDLITHTRDCNLVEHPEEDDSGACGWLVPPAPPPVPEASADAADGEVADAGVD